MIYEKPPAALSVESVLGAADEAVAEHGADYRYPRAWRWTAAPKWKLWRRHGPWAATQCQYIRPDYTGPACLIADILVRHGSPLAELALREGESAADVVAELYPGTSDEVTAWLDLAQQRQDDGERWGQIVDDLHEVLA